MAIFATNWYNTPSVTVPLIPSMMLRKKKTANFNPNHLHSVPLNQLNKSRMLPLNQISLSFSV